MSSAQAPVGDAAAGAAKSTASGVYTEEQAKRGEAVAEKLCVGCHGPGLVGGEAGPPLVGIEFATVWVNRPLAELVDQTYTTMPGDAPGTLTKEQTSDVIAYVLELNKYPAGQAELPTDLAVLKTIAIAEAPPAAQ